MPRSAAVTGSTEAGRAAREHCEAMPASNSDTRETERATPRGRRRLERLGRAARLCAPLLCVCLLASAAAVPGRAGAFRAADGRGESAPRTVEELRARIRRVLSDPQVATSHAAIEVVSLDTGSFLFEENQDRLMQPASNMKLFVVAAALELLGPDFRFRTSIYAAERPGADGVVAGDLVVYGRGDPSYSAAFARGGERAAFDELAEGVVRAGVRRVRGELVGDASHFSGERIAPGWAWDDLQWSYGVEVSALSVNDNQTEIVVRPGDGVGDPCRVIAHASHVKVVNRAVTARAGAPRDLTLHRAIGEDKVELIGTLPLDDPGYADTISISHAAHRFVTQLRAALERKGVQFEQGSRTVEAHAAADERPPVSRMVELAERKSPPLSLFAAQSLKPSQNLYTELILRALGERRVGAGATTQGASVARGVEAVKSFLKTAGIDPANVSMGDGAGLARSNLITARAMLQLLKHMSAHKHAQIFRDALPVAGVDGTLRGRMRGTPAEGNVRAKTGTVGGANALSGYVTSAAGERLAFSLIINNSPRGTDARAKFTDAIAVLLASFKGHS